MKSGESCDSTKSMPGKAKREEFFSICQMKGFQENSFFFKVPFNFLRVFQKSKGFV
jgi:hypothetical protein